MSLKFTSFAIAFSIATVPFTAHAQESDIALSIGRVAQWPIDRTGEISVSNGAIVRVVDKGAFVKITALKLGTSIIRSGSRQVEVNVLPETSFRIYDQLRKAIADRRGLEISASSGQLRIVGRLLRADDWLEIATRLPAAQPGQFSFQATVEPDVESVIRTRLLTKLQAVGISQANLRLQPDAVVTIGDSKDGKARAETLLAPLGIRVEANASVIALEPMVRVKILVAEVKKTFRRSFGVSWPSAVGGIVLPSSAASLTPIEMSLQALEENGWGRVLASPTLLCRSGKEAEFMAGGEFPIKLSSFKSSGVVWKNYGVLLRVKPVADVNGRMSIAIETEVSTLDEANKVEGLPGLFTNRMKTHFDLTKTRTIALSGLIKNDLSRHASGLPGLISIPVLGSLFSSREFKDDRSELIIFVTPSISQPDDAEETSL